MNENPYSPSEANVDNISPADSNTFIPGGRRLPFLNGAQWIDQTIKFILSQPKTWLIVIAIFIAIEFIFDFLPEMIGIDAQLSYLNFINLLLKVLLFAGMICVAESQRLTKKADIRLLGNGFVNRTGSIIGVMTIQIAIIVVGILGMITVIGLAAISHVNQLVAAVQLDDIDMFVDILIQIGIGKIAIAFAIIILAGFISQLLTCFAIPLIVINHMSLGKALSSSFSASLKNILPAIACFIAIVIIYLILDAFSIFVIIPDILTEIFDIIMTPVWYLIIYTAYHNIFTYSEKLQ